MKLNELKNKLKNKRVLILGFGREGKDNFLFLRKLFPKKVLGIGDQKPLLHLFNGRRKCVILHCGKNYLKVLKDYDVIIKSPGIPFKILPKSALRKITTQTEIFFENCPGKIIGIAGTKGKSTTASLIYKILKQGGFESRLVGNIGKPVLSFLLNAKSDNIFVYELSSFQLMNLKKSPQIAVLLNNYPDHLDYHKNFQEYIKANANITKYQTKNDFLIYNSQDKITEKIANKSRAKKIPIKGKHYELNMEAARQVAKIFKIPDKTISTAIKKFKFLPHRLEYVGKFKGIEFYNDSLSTIPETAIEALDFAGNKAQTLILGGFDRGLSFDGLAKRVVKSSVKTLILFPSTGRRIKQAIENFQFPISNFQYFFVKDIKKAVRLAYKYTDQGKVCLLSPASPSFGIFKDYKERGNLFKKHVKKYGHKKKRSS